LINRRSLLTTSGALMLSTLVPACGGGSSTDGQARVRLLNLSRGYDSLNLYLDGDLSEEAVAYGSVSDYRGYDPGSVGVALTREGSTSYLLSGTRTFVADSDYTLLAFGWEGHLAVLQASDSADAPDSGKALFRVAHLAPDAGELDIYVTGEDETLSSASPVASSVASGSFSSYAEMQAGSYRVRVTAADDPDDLRLDVSGVTLPSKGIISLVLVASEGGVLVEAALLAQGEDLTLLADDALRVRVVNSVQGNAAVMLSADGTALMSGSRAPTIGSYQRLPAGTLALTLTVDGQAFAVDALSGTAGHNLTLLVAGTPEEPVLTVVDDDLRLITATSRCGLRVMHGVATLADAGLTLTLNYEPAASDVAYGTASDFSAQSVSTEVALALTSPLSATALYTADELTLTAQGLYTVFALMNGDTPVGVLRKER